MRKNRRPAANQNVLVEFLNRTDSGESVMARIDRDGEVAVIELGTH